MFLKCSVPFICFLFLLFDSARSKYVKINPSATRKGLEQLIKEDVLEKIIKSTRRLVHK
jgi:hypothetical protein